MLGHKQAYQSACTLTEKWEFLKKRHIVDIRLI